MLILKRLIPYISTAVYIGLFQFSQLYYEKWHYWLAAILLLVAFSVLFLCQFSLSKDTLAFLLPALWFSLGAYAFLFFQDKEAIKQAIIFSGGFVYWLFTNSICIYLYKRDSYLTYSMENISNYLNLLSVFYIYTGAFSFYILSVSRLRWVMAAVFLVTLSLSWQTLWINKIHSSRFKYFSLILAAIIMEIFWALKFWPTSYYINGVMLTTAYFLLSNFARLRHLESLNKKTTIKYLAGGAFILTIILATAQWT